MLIIPLALDLSLFGTGVVATRKEPPRDHELAILELSRFRGNFDN